LRSREEIDMTDERIRPARVRITGLQEAQLPALVELDAACAGMYHAVGFDAAEVPTRSTSEIVALTRDHDVLVAEADHVVAGYAAWRDEEPGVAFITELSVHPDFQQFGVGRRLLSAIADGARRADLEALTVKCWERATWAARFYAKLGFTPITSAAPEKVRAFEARVAESGRAFTRPGEVALWAPVAPAE
jgi:amino-acid N-acetyltransferase